MERRSFLQTLFASAAALVLPVAVKAQAPPKDLITAADGKYISIHEGPYIGRALSDSEPAGMSYEGMPLHKVRVIAEHVPHDHYLEYGIHSLTKARAGDRMYGDPVSMLVYAA